MASCVIELIGSPSVGKSTTASQLFGALKSLGFNSELALECIKPLVYKGIKITPYTQYAIFGQEVAQLSNFFNKVKFIVSDSSPLLAAYYNYHYNNKDNSLSSACKGFYEKAKQDGVQVFNFFLPRKKAYNSLGRFQNEQQADQIAIELREWLDAEGYSYSYLDCPDEDRVNRIIECLKGGGVLND